MTINPQINTKDFLLALEREADNRENKADLPRQRSLVRTCSSKR